ncbi:MAG: signal peptidase I [Clostridiales bacterium]|jgi:signal peptidase|nr:signal peptidase I [Clostridiales bacterium]
MRTAKDFNREYYYKLWTDEARAAKHPPKGAVIKSAIFYSLLLIMVMLAFFYSGNREPGKRFGPFAYNTVLTPSMNSVYPQGSLITSWAIRPDEYLTAGLEDGTDIVFILEDGKVIVHRIIEIMEDYEGSGRRAFRTQGVDNPSPDPWITIDANVIGRVTWHVPIVGDVLAIIADNILWVILAIAVISVIIVLFSMVFKKE